MEVTQAQMEMLGMIIVQNIKEEFAVKHMSGNLVHTISVYMDQDGLHVHIPAQTYNMKKFQEEGVVVHISNGSYASRLDEEGSEFMVYSPQGYRFKAKPKNHKGFIDRVINASINQWLDTCGLSVASREVK